MLRKYLNAPVVLDPALGERQIMVVASDPTIDRTKDVMRPEGCVLDNYRENNIVLASHDPTQPIGNATVTIRNGRVEALIDFAEKGLSAKADEWCGLAKAGVIRAVSVGFDPIEYKPNKAGGYDYDKWELMELSLVSVPANPSARIIARSIELITEEHPPLNAKGMYGLACLASILDDLGYLHVDDRVRGRDGRRRVQSPRHARRGMRSLGNTLIAMSSEEAAELLAGAGAIPDDVAAATAAVSRSVREVRSPRSAPRPDAL